MADDEVFLYVYDLSNGLARSMSLPLLGRQIDGIWHTSVVYAGVEVFFGQGISMVRPGTSHHGTPLKQISMGKTGIDHDTFLKYIDQIRETYRADRYHVLDFNCNSFTGDVIGFLTGGQIPREIRELPADFLNTPFGAALRPTIDSMFASTAPALPPNVPAAEVASAVQSGQANAAIGRVDHEAASRTLTASLTVCTNPASFQSILRNNKAVVAMFTSDTCPPCHAIKPVFESIAADAKHGAYVLVDAISGSSLSASRQIRATPTFQFFLSGNMVHELKGTDARALRSQIDQLIYQAYPPHPHTKLKLPRLRTISHQKVTYAVKPNFDALSQKLSVSKIASSATLSCLQDRVVPVLSSQQREAECTSEWLEGWLVAHRDWLQSVPPSDWFPALDLVRFALVDSRFQGATLAPLVRATQSNLSKASASRPTNLTALRLLTNAQAAELSGANPGIEELAFLISSLLAEHKDVRTAAASYAFMVTKSSRSTSVPEDWSAEVATALIEALKRETDSEVIHRLSAALGLLLLDSSHTASLSSLLEALEASSILRSKQGSVTTAEAKALIAETILLI